MPRSSAFNVRKATTDDAPGIAAVLRQILGRRPDCAWAFSAADEHSIAVLTQTGYNLLVATFDEEVVGVIRTWDEEGVGWFDMLAASRCGAGQALLRAVEQSAQDAGLRLLRLRVPEDPSPAGAFHRWGYMPVSHEVVDSTRFLVLEKRLPLLTVREQRREDAAAIAELTGRDPWFFEQQRQPGWFVAADGDRVVGVIGVREAAPGIAAVEAPVLRRGYEGRRLELWMTSRAVTYAETKGFHTATLPDAPNLRRFERDLEDDRWHLEQAEAGRRYVRSLSGTSVIFREDRESYA